MLLRTRVLMALVVSLSLIVACQPQLDRTPDPFSFTPVTGAELGATVTSNAITVAGIDAPATLTVSGGDAVPIVNGDVAASGDSVVAGDEVQVRVTASDQFVTAIVAEVTIGGVSAEFSVTTRAPAPDTTPDVFSFDAVVDAELSASFLSGVVTVAGVDVAVPASVAGDASAVLVVDGVDVVGGVDVEAGDEVAVRLTSSGEYATSVTATVTLGGVSADFVVTTKAAPVAPAVVAFDAASASVLWGDEDVELSWTVSGDVTSLVLVNDYDAVELDVTGSSGVTVTVPSDVPSITYTLTASNAELAVSASDDVAVEVELWVCSDSSSVVSFADPALEAALRLETALPDVGDITCGDMQGLTEFFSGHFLVDGGPDVLGEIESLAGLQHAVNLEALNLQVNLIRDVTPLQNLMALRELILDLNPVEDLAPIAGLTNLTLLSLWHMRERDLGAFPYSTTEFPSALCGTAGLDDADVETLSELVNLSELYMSYNAVTDLSVLAGMEGLELVFMACNAVESFAPLDGLAGLTVVWANDNDVSDAGLAAAASWSELQWLRLDYNRVSDLAPLGSLANLYAVSLEGNFLETVEDLADNLAFPAAAGPLPVAPPADSTLDVGFNCLDTTPGSPADLQTQAIEARGVTIVGFNDADQRDDASCAAFAPFEARTVRVDTLDGPFGRSFR